jgi:hypothetical protein
MGKNGIFIWVDFVSAIFSVISEVVWINICSPCSSTYYLLTNQLVDITSLLLIDWLNLDRGATGTTNIYPNHQVLSLKRLYTASCHLLRACRARMAFTPHSFSASCTKAHTAYRRSAKVRTHKRYAGSEGGLKS